ncbi:tyrosine-type recombinase/integrase [Caballeronia sp. DA-9]|uniref:tyrosine-type recombinase/integrase n=1 Tax=Caballeronia sp. DA-9 TaxID=3436237 RepID=UPI003F6623CB
MASFSKRTNSTGEVTHQAKCRRNGFPTLSKTFRNLADAKKWARQVERGWDNGEVPAAPATEGGHGTLADVLKRYRDEVAPNHKGGWIESLTINAWIRDEPGLVGTQIHEISPTVIAAWRDRRLKVIKPSSVARQMNILNSAISKARLEWGMPIPDCKVARPKSPPHRERVLADKEEAALLLAAGDFKPVIEFAIATAMRQGEIAALRWPDIDWERKIARLHTSKNGLPRDVPLSKRALTALECMPRGTGPVFGLSAEAIKRKFIRLTRRLKIVGLRFHDLRHTAITHYAQSGLNPLQLAVISGHRDIRMLSRYTHLKADDIALMMG